MRHPIRFLTAMAACVALLATLTGVAIAQGVLGEKFRSGDTVTVAAGETVSNDLYAFAGTVRVDGTVDGDLVASGGLIDVTGTVTGDVLAAGGSVNITGTVGGDTRIAGGTLSVGGAIKEDLLATGGQLTVTSSGTVGEDLIAGTGRLTIDGAVTGDVLARAGTYTKTGTIGGTEDVTITPQGQPTGSAGRGPDHDPAGHRRRPALPGRRARRSLVDLVRSPRLRGDEERAPATTVAGRRLGDRRDHRLRRASLDRADRDDPARDRVRACSDSHDLIGMDILGGIVAILGASLVFAVVAGYVADALVGVALASIVMRSDEPEPMARIGRACGGCGDRGPRLLPAGRGAVGQAGRRPARARRRPDRVEATTRNGRRRGAGRSSSHRWRHRRRRPEPGGAPEPTAAPAVSGRRAAGGSASRSTHRSRTPVSSARCGPSGPTTPRGMPSGCRRARRGRGGCRRRGRDDPEIGYARLGCCRVAEVAEDRWGQPVGAAVVRNLDHGKRPLLADATLERQQALLDLGGSTGPIGELHVAGEQDALASVADRHHDALEVDEVSVATGARADETRDGDALDQAPVDGRRRVALLPRCRRPPGPRPGHGRDRSPRSCGRRSRQHRP